MKGDVACYCQTCHMCQAVSKPSQVIPPALHLLCKKCYAFPVLKTRQDLRCFLVMAGYYRCFCKNFSGVVLPLDKLLCQSVLFKRSPECQTFFDSVKLLLAGSLVLSVPDMTNQFKLEVDASGVCHCCGGSHCVLLQRNFKVGCDSLVVMMLDYLGVWQ